MTDEARMYQKMYHLLVGAAEDAITTLEHGGTQSAVWLLQKALQDAEELYIRWDEIPPAEENDGFSHP